MRLKLILLIIFFVGVAMAVTPDEACDLLRTDPEIRLPNLTDKECQRRFRIMGTHWYVLTQKKQVLEKQARAALRAEQRAVDAGMPQPTPGPTPTATSTATSTPTATSTATGTPTATATHTQ